VAIIKAAPRFALVTEGGRSRLAALPELPRVAYGRWDRQFGAWIEHEGEWHPFCPITPGFGRLGVWLEPEGERTDAWFEERAVKAAYFSLIPNFARRMVANQGDPQWSSLLTLWNKCGAKQVRRRLICGDKFANIIR
jgi:hypothetical protein